MGKLKTFVGNHKGAIIVGACGLVTAVVSLVIGYEKGFNDGATKTSTILHDVAPEGCKLISEEITQYFNL